MSKSTPQLNKENSVQILINTVRSGHAKGAFLVQETRLLKDAIAYFNKDVKEKPDFGSKEDPELVAINLLLQASQKVNSHRENPLSIEDSALVYDVFEFWQKTLGAGVAANTEAEAPKEPKKKAVSRATVEEDDEDEEEQPKSRLLSVKGKERL